MANKEAMLMSQVANLEAQNTRIIKEKEDIQKAYEKYNAFWIAAEKQIEELESRQPDTELVGELKQFHKQLPIQDAFSDSSDQELVEALEALLNDTHDRGSVKAANAYENAKQLIGKYRSKD